MTHKQLPRIISCETPDGTSKVPLHHPAGKKGEAEKEQGRRVYGLWIDNLSPSPRGGWLEYPSEPLYGMSPQMQAEVWDAQFIPTAKAIASIEHLWATGLGLWHDPLLQGFDSIIRYKLSEVAEAAFFAGFWLLTDYLYDSDKRYYAAHERKVRICALANYAFWANKMGSGLLLGCTGLKRYVETPRVVVDMDGRPGLSTAFAQACQRLYDELLANEGACNDMERTAEDAVAHVAAVEAGKVGEWNGIPIADVEFSDRTFKCLTKENINTLGQLVQRTEGELLSIKHFGMRSLEQVIAVLESYDMVLAETRSAGRWTPIHPARK